MSSSRHAMDPPELPTLPIVTQLTQLLEAALTTRKGGVSSMHMLLDTPMNLSALATKLAAASSISTTGPTTGANVRQVASLAQLDCKFDVVVSLFVSTTIVTDEHAADYFDRLATLASPGALLLVADWHVACRQDRLRTVGLWSACVQRESDARWLDRVWGELRPRDEELVLEFLQLAGFKTVTKLFQLLVYGVWMAERGEDDPFEY